jgi:hypothetical protein
MFGLGILVGLGRRFLAGPVADSGMLPSGYYRHLALAAMEEEDFTRSLECLQWADDLLLVQIFVFRLRLLRSRHQEQCQALEQLLDQSTPEETTAKIQSLLRQVGRAVELLENYEAQALKLLPARPGEADAGA